MSDFDQFKEPFNVYLYIDNLISKKVVKWKNFSNYNDIKNIFDSPIEEMKEKSSKLQQEIAKINIRNTKDVNNDSTTIETINKTLSITCDTLSNFCDEINALGKKMNKFGKAIAIHDMAIEQANNISSLLNRFQFFLSSEYKQIPVPEEINDVLTSFQTLQSLKNVTELLKSQEFARANKEIIDTHARFESVLKNEIIESYKSDNIERMKRIIDSIFCQETLKSFYTVLIDYFLKKTDENISFVDYHISSFEKFSKVCQKIFHLSYKITIKFYVQSFYERVFKDFINSQLEVRKVDFLVNLENLYQIALKIEKKMLETNDIEAFTIENYRKSLFGPFLSYYFEAELHQLNNYLQQQIQSYNDMANNSQKSLQELTVNIIQHIAKINKRMKLLSSPNMYPENTHKLYQLIIENLIMKVAFKELDIISKSLSANNLNNCLNTQIFELLDQINSSIHLIQKFYDQFILPSTFSTVYSEKAIKYVNNSLNALESKIDACLDKYINTSITCLKSILDSSTQECTKLYIGSDFNQSAAMVDICNRIKKFNTSLKSFLTNQNYTNFGFEFCVRFCKCIVLYYKEFNYSVDGAMIALYDVRELKGAFSIYKNPEIDEIFETLHSLINLLVLESDQVTAYSLEGNLIKIDSQMVQAFIDRRSDSKISKLKL